MTELDNFRKETKEWLDKNCPPSMRNGADPKIPLDEVWGGRNAVYKNPESKIWLDRMGKKGWTMPTVPKEYGGGGLNKDEVKILNEAEEKFKNVVFLSFEQNKNKDIAKLLNIDYWTTIAVYKNNKEIVREMGLTNKDEIFGLIKKGI